MAQSIEPKMLQEWLNQKLDAQTLEKLLWARGLDQDAVKAHLAAYRKLRRDKRQTVGFVVTAAGALLGFISCVLSLTNPIPSLYDFILFGVTSVAILLIVAGMYLIFEA